METNINTNKKDGFLKSFPFFVSVALAFLTPLFFIPWGGISFSAGKVFLLYTAVILLLLVWILEKIKDKKFLFSKNLLVVSSCLIPLVYLISAFLSGSFLNSFVGVAFEMDVFLVFASLFLMMFLVAKSFDKKRVFTFYFALLFSGSLMFIVHILRIFLGANFLSFGILSSPVSSLVGSWTDLGIFFAFITIIAFLASDYIAKDKRIKIISILATVLSLVFVALVNSRFLWVSLAVISLLGFLHLLFVDKIKFSFKNIFRKTGTYVFLVSLLFVLLQSQIGHWLPNLAGTPNMEVRPTMQGTLEVAKNTATQNLLLGTGPNTFVEQWRLYKPLGVNITDFWNTDFSFGSSLILSSLVSVGLIGFLLWFLFIGSILFYVFKLALKKGIDSIEKFVALSISFLSLFGVITLFFYTPGFSILLLIFLIFGVLLAQLKQNSLIAVKEISWANSKIKTIVSAFVLVALISLPIFSFYFFTKKVQAASYFNQAATALSREDGFSQGYALLAKAIETNPTDFYLRNLTNLNLVQLQNLFAREDIEQEELQAQFQEIFGASIGSAQGALQANPNNYLNWLGLAKVYSVVVPLELEGSYEAAVEAYQKAISLNPTNPMLYLSLANLEITKGDTDKAKEYIQASIQLKQNYSDAYFLLSRLNMDEGNKKEAVQVIEQLATVSPYDPLPFYQLGAFKYEDQDYENAKDFLERAVALSPYYSDAKYLLGLTYDASGEKEKAVGQFQDLKFLNPEEESIDAILSNIQEGRDPFAGFQTQAQTQPEQSQVLETETGKEEEVAEEEAGGEVVEEEAVEEETE